MTKTCSRCGFQKDVSEFYRDNRTESGYRSRCKVCISELGSLYVEQNKEKVAVRNHNYYIHNKDHRQAYNKVWYENNKERRRQQYLDNREKKLKDQKRRDDLRREELREYQRRYRLTAKGKAVGINKWNKRKRACEDTDISSVWLANLISETDICELCDREMNCAHNDPLSKTVDHIFPVNCGGLHCMDNVRVICRDCNGKRPKDGRDFLVL